MPVILRSTRPKPGTILDSRHDNLGDPRVVLQGVEVLVTEQLFRVPEICAAAMSSVGPNFGETDAAVVPRITGKLCPAGGLFSDVA
jgi:hypothetical protein